MKMSLSQSEKSKLSNLQSQIRSKQNEIVKMKESLKNKQKEVDKMQSDIEALIKKSWKIIGFIYVSVVKKALDSAFLTTET